MDDINKQLNININNNFNSSSININIVNRTSDFYQKLQRPHPLASPQPLEQKLTFDQLVKKKPQLFLPRLESHAPLRV